MSVGHILNTGISIKGGLTMFNISLWRLGSDKVTKDVSANVSTLKEAEVVANNLCKEILDYSNYVIKNVSGRVYFVTRLGTLVGSFTITKLG